jgi:hypothetical protein
MLDSPALAALGGASVASPAVAPNAALPPEDELQPNEHASNTAPKDSASLRPRCILCAPIAAGGPPARSYT